MYDNLHDNSNKLPKDAFESLQKGRMVIFTGAGTSIAPPSCLPSGEELINHFKNLLAEEGVVDNKKVAYDLPMVFQLAKHVLPENRYINELKKVFCINDHTKKPNKLHQIIAMLHAKYYISTNFDTFLDDTLEELYGKNNLAIISKDEEINTISDVNLIHLHGNLKEMKDVVLTHKDFIERFEKYPMLESLIHVLFLHNPVLFIGYSLSDINIRPILEKLKKYQPKPWYMVLFNVDNFESMFLKSLGITPIVLPYDKGIGNMGDVLFEFLFNIWRRIQRFEYYIPTKPTPRGSHSDLLERIFDLERKGCYLEAINVVSQVEEIGEIDTIWKANPTEFAQYAYYKIKLLDKINKWNEVPLTVRHLIDKLRTIGKSYPGKLLESIKGQIYWASSLPYLRSGYYEEIFNAIEKDKGLLPDNVPTDAIVEDLPRYADFHSILSIAYLHQFYKAQNIEHYHKAEAEIQKAEEFFRKYKSQRENAIVHYEGRMLGAKVFLLIAGYRSKVIVKDKIELVEEIDNVMRVMISKPNYDGWIRYGQLATRYCEAAFNLFKAEDEVDVQIKQQSIDGCIKIVTELYSPNSKNDLFDLAGKPLEIYKFNRLLAYAYKLMLNESSEKKSIEICKQNEAVVQKMQNLVYIHSSDWIFTPLN
jgi:tetratricopeptide (TPR) repeat protein